MNFQSIPFDTINSFGQQTMLDNPLFNVSWILGRFCNYKCSYCWPYAHGNQPDFKDLNTYKNVVDEIKRQARAKGFNHFHWSFSGGEPTAYKDLLELTKHIDDGPKSAYQSIHMTTNLSPGSKWWKSWAQATELLQRRSITASFHDEFAKEQEFGDKCLQLQYEQVFVTVNQVMVPERFYELYDRMSRLHERGINVTLKPQSNETASAIVDGYTEDMIAKMREGFPQRVREQALHQMRLTNGVETFFIDQAERLNAFGFNKFKGWTCRSGYQSIVIRGDEVKRGYSCKEEPLGTLNSFRLFDTPRKCVTDTCVSSADSKIPKYV